MNLLLCLQYSCAISVVFCIFLFLFVGCFMHLVVSVATFCTHSVSFGGLFLGFMITVFCCFVMCLYNTTAR